MSHHRSDQEQVEIIAARLKDEAGLKPFLDKWRLEPGESWQEEIETALGVLAQAINVEEATGLLAARYAPERYQEFRMAGGI